MKKCIYVASLILLGLLMQFTTIDAQEKANNRYFVGIGLSLHQITEQMKIIGDYKNENGQLTGSIMAFPFKNSPAEIAGVEKMDIILAVDGIPISNLEIEKIVKIISSGPEGSNVILKLKRLDQNGNTFREFKVRVTRGKIDRLAWIHMDHFTGGSLQHSDDTSASFSSKVSENKQSGEFTYVYVIKNTGKKDILAQWELLDLASSGGSNRIMLVHLNPGESKTFILKSKELPANPGGKTGEARIFQKVTKNYLKFLRENGFTSSEHDFSLLTTAVRSTIYGFIPEKYLKMLSTEN